MTLEEIIAYFSPGSVYKFLGTLEELQILMDSSEASYNYLRLFDGSVYLSTEKQVSDPRLTLVHEGTA